MMDRRQLLKGILTTSTVMALDTIGVKLATPEDVALLKHQGSEVIIGSRLPTIDVMPPMDLANDLYICDREGHYHRIGVITEISVSRNPIDISTAQDDVRHFTMGIPRIDGRFVGMIDASAKGLFIDGGQ